MGVRQQLEERERINAKKRAEVKTQLNIMKVCLAEAQLAHLPTVPFMEATLVLLKGLLKSELP